MDFLKNVVGDAMRQQEYRDFGERYDRGRPHNDISDREAAERYNEVSRGLSEEDYRLSAREAFERMTPEEREEFGRLLREEGQQRGKGDFVDRDGDGRDDRFQDPQYLADATSRMHREQPDLLGSMINAVLSGGGGGGLAGGMLGGSTTGGEGARGGGGGIASNPAARAAVAGIAAMAAKKLMSRQR